MREGEKEGEGMKGEGGRGREEGERREREEGGRKGEGEREEGRGETSTVVSTAWSIGCNLRATK